VTGWPCPSSTPGSPILVLVRNNAVLLESGLIASGTGS
jgi:hypothetical protein